VQAAWQGVDPAQLWDSHAHLVGTGDSGAGIYVNPRMQSLLHPVFYVQRKFFLDAACAGPSGSVDRGYVERMRVLVGGLRPGAKLLLLAFERMHDERGVPNLDRSSFYVPDAYTRDIARAYPQSFEWAASIHPYAPDAVERLEQAKRDGARAVKWLPEAMNIDPASPRCRRFYQTLAKVDLPLISHAGLERAVLGGQVADYGKPERLRAALDAGVRVVVAHCASVEDADFTQFAAMMAEPRYEKTLFGDISALPQMNRAGPALVRVIEAQGWHARLLNGSDYPLPGVMPLFSVAHLAAMKLVPASAVEVLKEIRSYNALLFDFVLKRTLRSGARALSPRIFETRRFFEPAV
jgi:uncharacterized protein